MIGKHHAHAGPTEMAGAVAVAPFLKSMHERIVALYEMDPAGQDGFTDDELTQAYEARFGRALRHSIGARRFELVEKGVLQDSGKTRPGPTGVENIVWSLV